MGQLLRQRAAVGALPDLRPRLGDATTVSRPGSEGADWGIHACSDAGRGCFDESVLTDATGGESLRRYPPRPGDVLVADRGYAHLDALAAIWAVPAHFVVRVSWNRFAFRTAAGEGWDLLKSGAGDACVARARVEPGGG